MSRAKAVANIDGTISLRFEHDTKAYRLTRLDTAEVIKELSTALHSRLSRDETVRKSLPEAVLKEHPFPTV